MSSAASSFIIKEDSKNYKLAKVVSTKLSIEDENLLQQITAIAYKLGSIKEPTLLSQQYKKRNNG